MKREQTFQSEWLPEDPSFMEYLDDGSNPYIQGIDLTIVPMGRSAEHIESAANMARMTDSMLLVLCSHQAKIEEVASFLENMPGQPGSWFVVEIPEDYKIPHVDLLSEQAIPGFARLDEKWNLDIKRNLGLIIGRIIANKSFFVDDDQTIYYQALEKLIRLSEHYDLVGLKCGIKGKPGNIDNEQPGFADRSVFMHARGEIEQYHMARHSHPPLAAALTSANSTVLRSEHIRSHFPKIYNEDWFFTSDSMIYNQAALADAYYYQDQYFPYSAERARREEFGEIAAYGLYKYIALFKSGLKEPNLKNPRFWDEIIEDRREGYIGMLDSLPARRNPIYFSQDENRDMLLAPMPPRQQKTLRGPLEAGLEMNSLLEGKMFVEHNGVWREDKSRWNRMLDELPYIVGMPRVLGYLALDAYIAGGRSSKTRRHR